MILGNVQRNAAAYYLLFGVTALAGFLVSPVLLTSLGAPAFGLFKAVQKLMDVASVADGRSGQALKWTIARTIGHGDHRSLRRSVSSAAQTALTYLPLTLLLVLLLTWLAPHLIRVPVQDVQELRALVFILGANLVFMPVLGIPDAVLVGSNRGYVTSLVQVATLIATNCAFVWVVKHGFGIVGLGVVVASGAVVCGCLVLFVARATTPWMRWERPSREQVKMFAALNGWLLAWAAVEKVLLSGEILVIAALVDAESVASYALATFPVQLFLALSLLTASSATPSIGALLSHKESEAVRMAEVLRRIISVASIVGACLLLLLNKSFLSLWVGGDNFIGDLPNLLIALSMMQVAVIRCDAQLGDLTLDVANRAKHGILASVLTILFPWAMIKWVDPTVSAALVGVLAARTLLALTVRRQVQATYGFREPSIRSVIASVSMLATSYWLGAHYSIDSWAGFVFVAMVATMALATVSAFFVGDSETRTLLTGFFWRSAGTR